MSTPQAAHYTSFNNAEPHTGIMKKTVYEKKGFQALTTAFGWGLFMAVAVGLLLTIWPPRSMKRRKSANTNSNSTDEEENIEMCICPRRVVCTSITAGLFTGLVVWLYNYFGK